VGSIQLNQPMAICFWVPPCFNLMKEYGSHGRHQNASCSCG
jgi:hypothetical protein